MSSNDNDPYLDGQIDDNPIVSLASITCEIVAVLDLELRERGLKVMNTMSRSFRRYDIGEFVLTKEEVTLGEAVNKVSYIGFAQAQNSGQMTVGQSVLLDGASIGEVAGFDRTHAPNHYNVIISTQDPQTGKQLGVSVGDDLTLEGY